MPVATGVSIWNALAEIKHQIKQILTISHTKFTYREIKSWCFCQARLGDFEAEVEDWRLWCWKTIGASTDTTQCATQNFKSYSRIIIRTVGPANKEVPESAIIEQPLAQYPA